MVKLYDLMEAIDANKSRSDEIRQRFMANFENIDIAIDDNGYVTADYINSNNNSKFKRFPVNFLRVNGTLGCPGVGLETLDGSPDFIGRSCDFDDNQLTSLRGGPTKVGGSFFCRNNRLTSLEGAPKSVGGFFQCNGNPIMSLDGIPDKIGKGMALTWYPNLPLLRLLRVPRVVLYLPGGFKSHKGVEGIMKKYRGKESRSDILACQKELIQNGFEGNASW